MALRKGSITGSLPLGLVPRLPVKPSTATQSIGNNVAPALSKEYIDAVNVLSEETMFQACSLLLSNRDYVEYSDSKEKSNNSKGSEKSDLEQLEDILKKCREAAKVIQKEEEALSKLSATATPYIPLMAPMARSGSMVAAAARASQMATASNGHIKAAPTGGGTSVGIGGKTSLPPNACGGVGPSRWMMPQQRPGGQVSNAKMNMKRPPLERDFSDPSAGVDDVKKQSPLTNTGSLPSVVPTTTNKKARKMSKVSTATVNAASCISPGPGLEERKAQTKLPSHLAFPDSNDSNIDMMMEGPPPSALNFLAKLNKEGEHNKSSPMKKPSFDSDEKIESESKVVVQGISDEISTKRKESIDSTEPTASTTSTKRVLPSRGSRK